MNLLFLCMTAFVLLFILHGYKKGLFKSAASAIGVVLAVILTALLTPLVNTILCDYTNLDENIKSEIAEKLQLPDDAYEMTRNDEMELLDELPLPETVKNMLIANCNDEGFVSAGVDNICEYIAVSLTDMVMSGIAYLITCMVVIIIIKIIIHVMDIASYIPIVKGINKFGGAVFGACEAMIFIWIFMAIITLLSVFEWASKIMEMTDESVVLSWLYKKDIFLNFIIDILGRI